MQRLSLSRVVRTAQRIPGVYQPDLQQGQLVIKKSFYEISAFVFTAQFLGMSTTAPLATMWRRGSDFCNLGWEAALEMYPDVPPQFLANYCFSSMYLPPPKLCLALPTTTCKRSATFVAVNPSH
jgi:hypothetical protein